MSNPLPAFLAKREQGLILDLHKLDSANSFFDFIEMLFSNGERFSGLDYNVFLDVLYNPEKLNHRSSLVRLAREITAFPLHRQSLYKSIRILDQDSVAEYFFETAEIEIEYEHPIYGEAQVDGSAPIIGYEKKTKMQTTLLNVDEFIAAMWVKGIKYGLQLPIISHAIAENKSNRLVIARKLSPIAGRDAGVLEEFDGLRQDNAPMIVDGKANLKRFKNRYPQIAKGCRMLRKIPMHKGVLGVTVKGDRLDPAIPKDFDLSVLSGVGTRVETSGDGLILVATISGFICIEEGSGIINVVERIESKVAITAKNTGDLDLTVDEFIAHGEVQEGREVKGKNMRFTSAVYGSLTSDQGYIDLLGNFSGGKATITGKGRLSAAKQTFNARIDAPLSLVTLDYAENSTVIADHIVIRQAINCILISRFLKAESLQACHVAANSMDIAASSDRRGFPVKAIVLLPDSAAAERQKNAYTDLIAKASRQISEKSKQLQDIKEEPDFAKYLLAKQALQAGKIQMTPALEERFLKLQRIHSGAFKTIERLIGELSLARKQMQAHSAELADFLRQEEIKASEHCCFITEVKGDTEAIGRIAHGTLEDFVAKPNNDLLRWMQRQSAEDLKIYYDESGAVAWQHSFGKNEEIS